MVSRGIVWHNTGYLVFATQWTFCRMDPLAIGASIAIASRLAPDRLRAISKYTIHLLWIVPLLIGGWNAKFGSLVQSNLFLVSGYTALAVMFGALLLVTITAGGKGPFVWFFNNPVLRLFGRLSYAMYLFNQPIKYALLKYVYRFPDPTMEFTKVSTQVGFFLLGSVLTVAAAWLSWHAFEKHFLRLKQFFPMDRAAKVGARDPLAASPIVLPQSSAGR
jgi:peptidoglycan/LPS O-acetylase OafA/YrhL